MKKQGFLLVAAFIAALSASISRADTDFSIEAHEGKVLYVDFWASWCTPCRASFPFMHGLAAEHGDNLVIAAINVDEKRSDAERFLSEFDINFDIVYDPEGKLAKSFDIKGMPTSYLYNRKGELVGTHVGFKNKDVSVLSAAIASVIESGE